MKIIVIAGGVLILILAGLYYFVPERQETADLPETPDGAFSIDGETWMRHSDSDAQIQFAYRTNPNGYVLEEREGDEPLMVNTFVLTDIDDAAELAAATGPREFPPTITLSTFRNTEQLSPRQWATAHALYSNINLEVSGVADTTIEGKDALRYRVDGLYATDTVIIAHGTFIYVVAGAFIDEDSQIRRDFEPFLNSLVFLETED